MRARFTIGPSHLDFGDAPNTITFTRDKFRTVTAEQKVQLELPDRKAEYGFEFDDGTEDDPLNPAPAERLDSSASDSAA